MPLVLALLALNGFFLGTANALAPMYITLVANLVNIGADYALIFGRLGAPELGVIGAAWAAVLANLAGIATGALLLFKKYRDFLREPVQHLFGRVQLALIFRTNINLLGRTLCLLFAQFAMLAHGIAHGGGRSGGQCNRLADLGPGELWSGWLRLCRRDLGGQLSGIQELCEGTSSDKMYLDVGHRNRSFFSVIYGLALGPIAQAFTEHQEVVDLILSLQLLIALIQPLNAVVFVFDGIFIGANDLGYLFRAMVMASLGIFVPAALLMVYWLDWGIQGVWLAYNSLMIGRFLTLLPRYRGGRWLRTFVV